MNNMTMQLDGVTFKTGDRITCTIYRTKIKNAKIYILTEREVEDCYIDTDDCLYDCGHRAVYICNNQKDNNDFEDLRPDNNRKDKEKYLGYKCIWSCIIKSYDDMDMEVTKIQLHKVPYVSPYDHFIRGNIDNLALPIENFIEQEDKNFYTALIGE
jgi:hypothetical protein